MSTPSSSPLTLDDALALRAAGEWETLAERGAAANPDALLAEPRLGLVVAVAFRRTGKTQRALELSEALEPVARRRGDRRLVADVVTHVGWVLWQAGRAADAEASFQRLLELAADWGFEDASADASNNLGILANVRGRRDLALTFYQRALASYRRLGNAEGMARTHHNLGISYRDLGFDGEADRHFTRVVELGDRLETDELAAMAEIERAMLRIRRGDPQLGAEMARRAQERFQAIGSAAGAADAQRVIAAAERGLGRPDVALAMLDEALHAATTSDDLVLRAEVQRDRGLLLRDQGSDDEAREALADAVASFAQLGADAEAEALRAILAELAPDAPPQ